MTPRPRHKRRSQLPRNLYERGGYYSWRNPKTGEEFGIGRNMASAIAQAIEANIHIGAVAHKSRLIHRLTGENTRTVEAWFEKYLAFLGKQSLKESTLKGYIGYAKRVVSALGSDTLLSTVDALALSDMFHSIGVDEGYASVARNIRAWLKDSFDRAKVDGWYSADNPVVAAKLATQPKVNRSRLSFEVFQRLYNATDNAWLKNAMALALISGQRRQDIGPATFKEFHDGGWWLTQRSGKTTHAHRIFLPLELRLHCFEMNLGDVVSQCRRTSVASPYLIHRVEYSARAKLGARLPLSKLSTEFTAAMHRLAIDWGDKTPPTFHEIRSLSERLYAAQGDIKTQHLLGHASAGTTATYHDARGDEWVVIRSTADLFPGHTGKA